MDPVSHGALAYLLYVGYAFISGQRLPLGWTLVPLAIGSQLPDLIDKPLAYWGVLVYGRSLAHSVFTMTVICASVWWLTRSPRADRDNHTNSVNRDNHADSTNRTDQATRAQTRVRRIVTAIRQPLPAALTIGYLAHLIGDSWALIARGDWLSARFLLYPVYRIPASPSDDIAPWIRLLELYREPAASMQLELVVGAAIVFVTLRIRAYRRGRWPHQQAG